MRLSFRPVVVTQPSYCCCAFQILFMVWFLVFFFSFENVKLKLCMMINCVVLDIYISFCDLYPFLKSQKSLKKYQSSCLFAMWVSGVFFTLPVFFSILWSFGRKGENGDQTAQGVFGLSIALSFLSSQARPLEGSHTDRICQQWWTKSWPDMFKEYEDDNDDDGSNKG